MKKALKLIVLSSRSSAFIVCGEQSAGLNQCEGVWVFEMDTHLSCVSYIVCECGVVFADSRQNIVLLLLSKQNKWGWGGLILRHTSPPKDKRMWNNSRQKLGRHKFMNFLLVENSWMCETTLSLYWIPNYFCDHYAKLILAGAQLSPLPREFKRWAHLNGRRFVLGSFFFFTPFLVLNFFKYKHSMSQPLLD